MHSLRPPPLRERIPMLVWLSGDAQAVIVLVPPDRTVHAHQRCSSAAALWPNGPSLRCPCFNPMHPVHDHSQGQQSFETEERRNASCGMPLRFTGCGGGVYAGVGTSASAAPSTGRPPAHHRPEAWHYWPQSLLPFRGKFLAKTVVIALITAMITAVFDLLGAGRW